MQQLSTKPEGFVYTAWCLDSKPDLVLVFGSTKKLECRILLDRMIGFMRGAMAFYRKERCLMIMDRDGVGYEVALDQLQSAPTFEELQLGNDLFGHLRRIHRPLSLVPDLQ
jgi:hypothetical protein